MTTVFRNLSMMGLLLLSAGAHAADWKVDNAESKLSFVSTKKVNVAEIHSFEQLSGGLNAAGEFALSIDLSSVNTSIAIRNERMKEFLFEVVDFPAAEITANIDTDKLNKLIVGQQLSETIEGKLQLHGQEQAMSFDVIVTKLADDTLFVVASKPLLLNVSDYQLVEGVEKLRELAGLASISHAVPVNFYLTLTAAN